MTTAKLIISAIVIVGTIFIYIWKRYGTKDVEIAKLKKQLQKIRLQMDDALRNRDYPLYHRLDNERMQLNERIAALRDR